MAKRTKQVQESKVLDEAEEIASQASAVMQYSDFVPRESFIPAYTEIERWMEAIINRTPIAHRLTERANASLVAQIASKEQKNCYGYFKPDAYTNKEGDTVHQVTVCVETFGSGIDQTVETTAHELVHAANQLAGVNDCNNNTHNVNFKTLAEKFGLIVEKGTKSQGWAITSMSPELKQWVDDELKPDAEAFTLLATVKEPKEKKPSKMKKWACECLPPTIVRCATELHATCEECGQRFTKEITPE